jgi:hypothetical protein
MVRYIVSRAMTKELNTARQAARVHRGVRVVLRWSPVDWGAGDLYAFLHEME